MQCKLVAALPEGDQWEYETKFDGYRALVIRDGEVAILSRRNNTLTRDFPGIAKAVEALPDGTVIDGEIIALDEHGKPAFNVLQNRQLHRDRVQYFAFDLLVYQRRSLLALPLERRREVLKVVLEHVSAPIHYSETFTARPAELIKAVRHAGFEGIVAKRRDSPYEPGKRSGAWSKLKFYADQELVIGGYIPGPHKFDALLVGYYRNNRLIFSGKIRNGFSVPGTKERVFARFRGLGSAACPFDNLPEPANARRGMALTAEAMKLCCWLKPKLVAQVGIREWTEDGHMRHSTFLGLRKDKDPREVVREEPTPE
jgi:bifunctional non-homologous end joining protein LigD